MKSQSQEQVVQGPGRDAPGAGALLFNEGIHLPRPQTTEGLPGAHATEMAGSLPSPLPRCIPILLFLKKGSQIL